MTRLAIALSLLCAPLIAQSAAFDHSLWDALLRRHVLSFDAGHTTRVDYDGMAHDQAELRAYLTLTSSISRAVFDRWSTTEQLAFLLNAYNAWTIELVLTGYPRIASIKDLGSLLQSPWKKPFVRLLDATRSLDDIENGLIRGSDRYRDPRVHFALNCASIGCPALRAGAYVPARLDAQLEESASRFLSDRHRNRFAGGTLAVSRIFDWYEDDFAQGWRGARSVGAFLELYAKALGLDGETARRVAAGEVTIEFLPYDWNLNRAP